MRISLITVCLNSEATIQDTLKSVSEQDYPDLEHIVFDGGSTDRTVEILRSYGNKIRCFEGSDTGIFDAMNQAIRYAEGDVIGIINSDDFYRHTQVLSRVVEEFKATGAETVYGDLDYVYRNNPGKIYRRWRSGEFELRKFRYGWMVPHPTLFVKKHVYDRYGLFDDSFQIAGDYELILRLLYKHRVTCSYIPEILVKMRNGGSSDGGVFKRSLSIKEDYRAWKLNGLKPELFTIPLKPLRKLAQFFL